MKRVLLLGGGHAHVHVLRELAREPMPGAEVLLLTPYARQMYSGMVPGLVAGHYAVDDCVIPLAPLAARAGVLRVESSATAFDANDRSVVLADGRVLEFDVASLDTGAVIPRDAIAGAREHALFVRPIEHFVAMLDPLVALAGQRSLGLALVGGGAAGVELAMALVHRLGERARVSLVTGGPPPLASHPASAQRRVRRALARARITVLEEACVEIAADHLRLASGLRLANDAAVVATGAAPAPWLAASGLALCEQGFVATGPTLQSVSHPAVFAVGDVAARPDAPHARSGVYAVRAGPPLALNLRRFVAGGELLPHHPQRRALNLIACGDRRAIASWGGWSVEGRWVWRWKVRIDREFIARYAGSPTETPA